MLEKFGYSKKIAVFWPDFQRVEKTYRIKWSCSRHKCDHLTRYEKENSTADVLAAYRISTFLFFYHHQTLEQMRPTFFAFTAFVALALLCSFAINKEEYGKAGYYADSLHGRKTASGEKYDKFDFTCAHKTLAFGTKIRVTRLDNKKSVVVRVNDRGPYVEGYVTDISRAAAEEIGLIKIGVTRVKIEVVEAAASARVAADADGNTKALSARGNAKTSTLVTKPAQYGNDSEPQPASSKRMASGNSERLPSELYSIDIQKSRKTGYGVQVSTLYDADNVLPVLKKLQNDWPSKVLVNLERDEVYNKSTYRVIIGPFTDKKAAEAQQKIAAKKGYKGCFVVDLAGM
jgi:rare lipoprotein A